MLSFAQKLQVWAVQFNVCLMNEFIVPNVCLMNEFIVPTISQACRKLSREFWGKDLLISRTNTLKKTHTFLCTNIFKSKFYICN